MDGPIEKVSRVPAEIRNAWAARHGEAAAERLAAAEDFADAIKEATIPPNTTDTYAKGWKVWQRFCAEQGLPETEGSRGALVAYVAWMLHEGRTTPGPNGTRGYAATSAHSHLTAAIVGLRESGHPASKDDHSEARARLEAIATQLAKGGERRGRGKAPAADLEGLHRVAAACDDSLTGRRDQALILTGFHFASRASEVSGLLLADVTTHARGIKVAVVTGKTRRSVRTVAIPYNNDEPEICPSRAWERWLDAYGRTDPTAPAFPRIDRWGHIGGAMHPDSVTATVTRVAQRSGIPIRWTGHSLRSGLATEGRKNGKDPVNIAKQGGWAPGSKAMLGYMQLADEWDDNAAAGLRRSPKGNS
ncbi:tyrosine-type recombinase/integrase [Streptomyces sp. NPDC007875]|uniref:tyrosine-type recombinase/integrase n=1 Tax=Streptomyces sp. NPDC007875 TaxID=3364783 RepID=UPI0036BEFD17